MMEFSEPPKLGRVYEGPSLDKASRKATAADILELRWVLQRTGTDERGDATYEALVELLPDRETPAEPEPINPLEALVRRGVIQEVVPLEPEAPPKATPYL